MKRQDRDEEAGSLGWGQVYSDWDCSYRDRSIRMGIARMGTGLFGWGLLVWGQVYSDGDCSDGQVYSDWDCSDGDRSIRIGIARMGTGLFGWGLLGWGQVYSAILWRQELRRVCEW